MSVQSFKLEPHGYFRRIPLEPHQLTERITPSSDVIVLCHLGVPQIDAAEWSLTVDGLVRQSKSFDLQSLRRFREIEIESVHECAGNPLQPEVPARRVSNAVWRGARLADVLADCGTDPTAAYVWSQGADYGDFQGVKVAAYVKDLPLSRVHANVLIATAMNGAPLSPEHGFPARLLVPGFYGTSSVKWLTRMTLAAERADGPFTTRWYNDPVRDENGAVIGTKPVWQLAPQSVIVSPAPGQMLRLGEDVSIWGWAWSEFVVENVKVTADAGAEWADALVEPREERGWQRFACKFTPQVAGSYTLSSSVFGPKGALQPSDGARNAWHRVSVLVE